MKLPDVFIFRSLFPYLRLVELELLQLGLFLTYLFPLENLSLRELLTAGLPELLEVFLLLILLFFFNFTLLDLVFA